MTSSKISELILQKQDFKNNIIRAVSDTLSKPGDEILEVLKLRQKAALRQINIDVQRSDSLAKEINKHYNSIARETLVKLEELLDVLTRIEQEYKEKDNQ